MNYDLSRIDYTICGITFPNTMKILPALAPKIQQKLAIGDKNGVLHCFSIKDEEPIVQFKTLPGKPITSVQLANASGKSLPIGAQADKIFAASGNEVKAYTRKGKVFLAIETSLSETITSMCVSGGDLILGSGRMVTHYRDLQEFHTYTCDDRVLDIAAFLAPNSTRLRLLVLVANKGAVILESSQVALRVSISSGPSRLAVPQWLHNGEIGAYFGAADGSIGIISLEGSELVSKSLVDGRSLGAVMSVGWFFVNGGAHLVIGRHDGSIQLYLVDMENIGEIPRLKYTYFCGEPVTSVSGGCVGTEEGELVATTFSGRVFALRPRRLIAGGMTLANIPHEALVARRTKLEAEIARLEKQAASERDKYQRSTRAPHAGLSTPPLLDIQCELAGAKHDGWQEITVTSVVPLDMLFLYCSQKLELQTDSAAVLSVCPSQGHAADLLATVRCQAGTKRLWVKARNVPQQTSTNAQSTKLFVYTLPAGAPRVARLITLLLPALPYYSQHEDPDTAEDGQRLWCELRVSGSFSVAEVTSWLTITLPGELPRPASSIAFARSHTLLRTLLICRYQRGLATFKCDNISTIVVIKDIITNSLVEKGIRVDISHDIPESCCARAFETIEDFFKKEYNKHKDKLLLDALCSLDLDNNIDNEGITFLCEDYLRVCKRSTEEIETCFEELVETVGKWYTDWCKLALRTVDQSSEKTKLKMALQACNLEGIKNILSDNSVLYSKDLGR